MTWNLSKVILALRRLSVTPLVDAVLDHRAMRSYARHGWQASRPGAGRRECDHDDPRMQNPGSAGLCGRAVAVYVATRSQCGAVRLCDFRSCVAGFPT